MARRALAAGAVVLVLLFAVGAASGAAVPAGPRLAVVEFWRSRHESKTALKTVDPEGGDPLRLAGDGRGSRVLPRLKGFSAPAWSPDGAEVVVSGTVGRHRGDDREPVRRLFAIDASGGAMRPIAGTNGARSPVPSPDGHTIAFTRSIKRGKQSGAEGKAKAAGFNGTSVWTVDRRTGAQRQLTPWRDGLHYAASSFSPDGSKLLATYVDERAGKQLKVVALDVDGGGSRILLDGGSEPVYSPDGSKIVLVRLTPAGPDSGEGTDLFLIDADGSGLRRLTHTPGVIEGIPSWDPSGERLAYTRISVVVDDEAIAINPGLFEVNADGSCATGVDAAPHRTLLIGVWQPGPGREAGRIEC